MTPDRNLDTNNEDSWPKWAKHVLLTLQLHTRLLEEVRKEMAECERRSAERDAKHEASIAALKVQAGLVGLMGGTIPAIAVLIYFLASQ